jgi:hypothetical protein
LGNAFDYIQQPQKPNTILHVHPPFDVPTLDSIAIQLEAALDRCPEVHAIVIFPCWDNELQHDMGLDNSGTPLKAYRLLANSTHCQVINILPRERFPFYDSYRHAYSTGPHTVALLLSSAKDTTDVKDVFTKYIQTWETCAYGKVKPKNAGEGMRPPQEV